MPQESTEPTEQQQPQEQPPATSGEDQLGEAGKRAIDEERKARAEADKRAKALERELEQLRKQAMTDSERAVAEAEERGRANAAKEFGERLAKTAFEAAIARRNPNFDVSALEYLDMARFVSDSGEPDAKEIAAAVERLIPAPSDVPLSFDGGTRTPAPGGTDMNQVIRGALRR